jgi:NitT/TauT family transport system permease protein
MSTATTAIVDIGAKEEALASGLLSKRNVERFLSLISPIFLLGLWQFGASVGWIDTRFFPSPAAIFEEAYAMILSGELWMHCSISLQRIVIGYVIGAVPGVLIGLAMGLFGPVRAIIQPLVDATFPIPKIAVLPLFIMVFGLGEQSKYAIIATAVIYLVLINTVAGVRNIDKIYLDVGKNFGASNWMMFTDVALPGALPLVVAGLKLGMGIALLVIVSAEFVGARSGIGYLIWTSWQTLVVENMFVGIIVVTILGVLTTFLLHECERLLVPWRQE